MAIAGLSGMGGVGKSELAVQYARRHLSRTYRGGVVWLSAERAGTELVTFAKGQFFAEMDLAQFGDLAGQLAFVESHWPGMGDPVYRPASVLWVFDDVTDYGSQVEPFLPSDRRFRVLVTTRLRLDEQQCRLKRLDLDVLEPEDARALLEKLVTERPERLAAETEVVWELLEWLGRLPLALELVGGLLEVEPDLMVAGLFAQLREEKLRHEAIKPVEVAFEVSWERLAVAERQLAMGLSLFAGAPIPWGLVEATIAGCEQEAVEKRWCRLLDKKVRRKARRELVRRSLLARVGEERYGLHLLVREFFAGKLAQRREAMDWRRAFVRVMGRAAEPISQTMTFEEVVQIELIVPHLSELLERFKLSEFPGATSYTSSQLSVFYLAQGLFERAATGQTHTRREL